MNLGKAFKLTLACILFAAAISGCASAPKAPPIAFFPPAPEAPRLQFLKGISGSGDVEVPKDSTFSQSLVKLAAGEEDAKKPILQPSGIRFVDGKLYVCDLSSGSIHIIDNVAGTFTDFTSDGIGKLKRPLSVAVDSDGAMYVIDAGRGYSIIHYDASGDFVGTLKIDEARAKLAEDSAEVSGEEARKKTKREKSHDSIFAPRPIDIAVDRANVYVLMNVNEIKVVSKKTGKVIRSFGKNPDGSELYIPASMTLGENGLLYVTNNGSSKVTVFQKDGKPVGSFGEPDDGPVGFSRPKGIAVGKEGRIWAVDSHFNNVRIFEGVPPYSPLLNFGEPGLPQGSLNLPSGIAVTKSEYAVNHWQQFAAPGFVLEEVVFVTNQTGTPKISAYGLGHADESFAPQSPAPQKGKKPKVSYAPAAKEAGN